MGFVRRTIEKLADATWCLPSFESLASKVFAVILTFLLCTSFVVYLVELFVFLVLCGPMIRLPFCEICCK